MNELVETDKPSNPFAEQGPRTALTAASDAEVSRNIAEIQAMHVMARRFPRDPRTSMDLVLQDCTLPILAEKASYQYRRGTSEINGPTIRIAEAIARRWGNIACGVRETARHDGWSECKAYAQDLESGYYEERLFQVPHVRETQTGSYDLRDSRDIYEHVANLGARRKRACILALLPPDIVKQALHQCEVTMRSQVQINDELIASLTAKFEQHKVTREMIEIRIQRRLTKDNLTPQMAVQLGRIYNSLEEGESKVEDWFKGRAPSAEERQEKTKRGRQKPQAKGGEKSEDPKPPADDKPAEASQIEFIRNKAKAKTITEAEICKAASIEKLEALPSTLVNAVIAWLDNPMTTIGKA